ncbi:hypothetical protein [Salimicrobium flavidum]|uniref:Lipoprotein n=1 Tax=Salimicrobium flavidum TaxID=570947 RepID=A0A1N7J7Y5_9BACI|nr:hypothetical protein [Salimicrobium flavidum]SIS45414.1 hypothetical protein SAMN05421687_104103 [Salimicrobium flavidum]
MKIYVTALFITLLLVSGCSSDSIGSFEKKGDMDRLVVQKVVDGETSSSRTKTVTDADTIAEVLKKGEGLGAKTVAREEFDKEKEASSSYYTFRSYQGSDSPVYSIVVLEDGTFLVEGNENSPGLMKTTDTYEIILDDMKQLAGINF